MRRMQCSNSGRSHMTWRTDMEPVAALKELMEGDDEGMRLSSETVRALLDEGLVWLMTDTLLSRLHDAKES